MRNCFTALYLSLIHIQMCIRDRYGDHKVLLIPRDKHRCQTKETSESWTYNQNIQMSMKIPQTPFQVPRSQYSLSARGRFFEVDPLNSCIRLKCTKKKFFFADRPKSVAGLFIQSNFLIWDLFRPEAQEQVGSNSKIQVHSDSTFFVLAQKLGPQFRECKVFAYSNNSLAANPMRQILICSYRSCVLSPTTVYDLLIVLKLFGNCNRNHRLVHI